MQSVRDRKLYYTEEQYRYARDECSALEYAMRRGYPLVRKGRDYYMRDHDSMVFTPDGWWFWNSRGLRGRAIEFAMAYEDKTQPEAVLALVGAEGQTYADVKAGRVVHSPQAQKVSYALKSPEPIEKAPFVLPVQSNDFRRLFGYLCGTRKLDGEILRDLIQQSNLYESCHVYHDSSGELKEIHNAVFVGRDAAGEPKSAFQRGLSSFGANAAFKRDVPGSDPSAAFCLPGRKEVSCVIVFEAAIDAISHASMYKDAGLDVQDCDRIALGGTEKIQGLTCYLGAHPNIKEVAIATDEDQGGRNAEKKITEVLIKNGFPKDHIFSIRQDVGKDWNDYLVRWRQVAEQAQAYPTTAVRGNASGKPVGRIHYLNTAGKVVASEAYSDRCAMMKDIRLCLYKSLRIVAETPAQQERIHRAREAHFHPQMQTAPEPENEMEMEL